MTFLWFNILFFVLLELDSLTIYIHCMGKSNVNILQNLLFCVPQEKLKKSLFFLVWLICTCDVLTVTWSFLFSISSHWWILVFVYEYIWPDSPLSLSFAFLIWQDVMNYRKTNTIRQSRRMPISTMHRVNNNISHSTLKPCAHGNTDLGRFLALHPQSRLLDVTHVLWGKPPCSGAAD